MKDTSFLSRFFMHLLYVDESGDDGFPVVDSATNPSGPSKVFVRAGLIIHDRKWRKVDSEVKNFRFKYKIPPHIELHASAIRKGTDRIYEAATGKRRLVSNWFGQNFPDPASRMSIIKNCCTLIGSLEGLCIICIVIDKKLINTGVTNYRQIPKERSWEFLIERYNLYLDNAPDKLGCIISDAIQDKIERTHRDFAKALFVNSSHIQDYHFIESIMFEPSDSSNLLQLVDIAAYSFYRYFNEKDSSLYSELSNRLLCNPSGSIDGAGLKVWPRD